LTSWIFLVYTPTGGPAKVDPDSITSVAPTILGGGGPPRNWTFELPERLGGLLQPAVYVEMCRTGLSVNDAGLRDYNWVDQSFVEPTSRVQEKGTCDRSLTYMLRSTDPGFGVALLSLWSAYGLAKLENRTFFIDDTDWYHHPSLSAFGSLILIGTNTNRQWGEYETYFLPPTTSSCKRPPPNIVLPCPHHARHLLVSHSTTPFTFGHAFTEFFEDPRKMGVQRQHKIFALARSGYESLFRLRLTAEDEESVEARKREIGEGEDGVIGVHVRRGDGKAKSFQWKATGGQVPNEHYAEIVSGVANANTTVVLASDDAAVYSAAEFEGYVPAQEQSAAAARFTGGFTGEAYRSADRDQVVAIGREYLRDIKVLGELAAGVGGRVFCDGASATCRVLAVMMGWERAVEEEGWKNIDGDRGWFGVDW
jgi:hypothetical protein